MRINAPEHERVVPVDIVDNMTTALGIAAQGVAATLAPSYVGVLAAPFGLIQLRVVEPETVRKVCLYRPAGRSLSPAAEGFAEFLASELPRYMETLVMPKRKAVNRRKSATRDPR